MKTGVVLRKKSKEKEKKNCMSIEKQKINKQQWRLFFLAADIVFMKVMTGTTPVYSGAAFNDKNARRKHKGVGYMSFSNTVKVDSVAARQMPESKARMN